MNETTLKIFKNLSPEKQDELIALMTRLSTYYLSILAVLSEDESITE